MHVGYDFAAWWPCSRPPVRSLDYRTKKIPNWLTVPAAVLGLAYHLARAAAASGRCGPWPGSAIGFGLLLLPWLLGGGGMGDVKMLAALGTWLGPLGILVAFGLGAMLAAVGMIGVLIGSTVQRRLLGDAAALCQPRRRRQLDIGRARRARPAACCRLPCRWRWARGWCWAGCCSRATVSIGVPQVGTATLANRNIDGDDSDNTQTLHSSNSHVAKPSAIRRLCGLQSRGPAAFHLRISSEPLAQRTAALQPLDTRSRSDNRHP